MAIGDLKLLEPWARAGYAARGFVYLLLGWVALSTGRALSTDDAVAEVEKLPAAPLLLALLAAGLFGMRYSSCTPRRSISTRRAMTAKVA